MPLVDAAHGAHLIAASNMMRAIRAVSSERGRDPREFALFAFGGNGPLFAAGMARAARDAPDRGAARARPLLRVRTALRRGRAPLRPHAGAGWCARPTRPRCGDLVRRMEATPAPSSPPRASAERRDAAAALRGLSLPGAVLRADGAGAPTGRSTPARWPPWPRRSAASTSARTAIAPGPTSPSRS